MYICQKHNYEQYTDIMTRTTPDIQPMKIQDNEARQSQYDNDSKSPMRAMICWPSGSDKTISLQNMILDIYKGYFERKFIVSPSIDIDRTQNPVTNIYIYIYIYICIKEYMKAYDTEQFYFDRYDPAALTNIMNTQNKVI